jgi:hypothetical protein
MSNAERQREFRERNPGYYGRLHAIRRAECRARVAALLAAARQAVLPAPLQIPLKPILMLPAPVQDPTMAAIDALAASLASRSAGERLPLSSSTNQHADSSRAA